jgi:nitrilase
MPVAYPRFKAAACHVAPVFMDSRATIEKAIGLIREAANHQASLVVFPESFVPGFPIWSAVRAPIENHAFFSCFAAQTLKLDDPEIVRLQAVARDCAVHVSIGISEGTTASVGCFWNTNLLIGPDGAVLNVHRKLVPTYYEKLIWANGDGRGLRVTPTAIGRIGALICGENTNPLARYTLMADGEQVHISTYPPIWPTRPYTESGGYDIKKAIEIRAGAHAFEAKVFNIVSSSFLDESAIEFVANGSTGIRDLLEHAPRSVSMIFGPTGTPVSEALSDCEGIVYGDIDTALSVEQKQFHDVTGYYNRFDIFHLTVDRTPREPVRYIDVPVADVADRPVDASSLQSPLQHEPEADVETDPV